MQPVISKKDYLVKHNAGCCPVLSCQSEDISGGSIMINGTTAIQEVICNICSAAWEYEYRLVDFEMISEGHE